MKTAKKDNTIDAVKMMREIREKISAETQNMTFEELKQYIKAALEANSKMKQVSPKRS